MAKNTLPAGTLFAIPFEDRFAVGKLLYVSEHVKDAFGFVVLNSVFDDLHQIEARSIEYVTFSVGPEPETVLHADIKNVTRRKVWPIVGELPVSDGDRELLMFGIGGTLFNANTEIKSFESIEERQSYPQLATSGNKLIEIYLSRTFS